MARSAGLVASAAALVFLTGCAAVTFSTSADSEGAQVTARVEYAAAARAISQVFPKSTAGSSSQPYLAK